MGSFSDYAENKILDHVLKVAAFTVPTALYIALSTADPTDDGSGLAEPSGGSYARVQHDAWAVAAARATSNTGAATFPEATGSWGTITHWAIFDASTGGNMIAHGSLNVAKSIGVGDTFSFAEGDVDISIASGAMSTYLANEILDHVFKVGAYTVPTNIYAGLATAAVTDATTGSTITEPGDTYERQQVNTWDVAAGGASANTGAITFPEAGGNQGTVSYTALLDAAAAGNVLFYAAVGTAKGITAGDTPRFAAGAWDVTLT